MWNCLLSLASEDWLLVMNHPPLFLQQRQSVLIDVLRRGEGWFVTSCPVLILEYQQKLYDKSMAAQ